METIKRKKIVFIGPLSLGNSPFDGETAKNQMLYDYLHRQYGRVIIVDTLYWRRSLMVILKLIYSLVAIRNKIVIISVCTLSAYHLSKFLYFLGIRKNLYYFVIGNTIALGVENRKYLPKYYSIYSKIFVEGNSTKRILENYTLNNIQHLPNFKKIEKNFASINKSVILDEDVIKFVFLSRITEDKGVTLILDAIEKLNIETGSDKFSVTFFGPIEEAYKSYFLERIKKIPNSKYGGYLNLQSIVGYKNLASHHVMLFPTYWKGEGFPGIIIDAYISGLPIIASDWNLNAEIVEDSKTGYVIEPHCFNALAEKMHYFITNPRIIRGMSKNCKLKASLYDVDYLLNKIDLT